MCLRVCIFVALHCLHTLSCVFLSLRSHSQHTHAHTRRMQVLTELASVPDDATQPQHLHTAAKMRRCFGELLGPTGGGGGGGGGGGSRGRSRGARSRLFGGAMPAAVLPGWGGMRGPGSRPVE